MKLEEKCPKCNKTMVYNGTARMYICPCDNEVSPGDIDVFTDYIKNIEKLQSK